MTAREHVADDVVALRLEGDGPLPRWQPGAHVALRLPSGRRRTYSLCGDPLDRAGYRVAVRRLGGGSAEPARAAGRHRACWCVRRATGSRSPASPRSASWPAASA
ncbi:hypothetical protein GCM10025868_30400 [Angustibacter aerolatus]|uniref:FAD-binding FR-type domain-containing protein n=1 Tax=Angustibacter aerolatus TaxID=1162965 RepID=A0ABQ6JLY6_9ACTN|nr:hypothetical protein [Angustibacter aerolatus]GMA87790.1 hypothetical protein GCM10025868_30400 [Angustibacter aerolatus]